VTPPIVSANLKAVGSVVAGVVWSKDLKQQTDRETREPIFDRDGKPANELWVILETTQRRFDVENDCGLRRLYVKTYLGQAVVEAVRKYGGESKKLDIGGWLAVKHTEVLPPKEPGYNGAKLYVAEYLPVEVVKARQKSLGAEWRPVPFTGGTQA
jgi:hypothetical protein